MFSRVCFVQKKQLKDLSLKVHTTIQPVFVSRKIEQELNVKETKPPIVDQQCVVYGFQCELCDADYVGYIRGHLHNRVKGHRQQSSTIAKHYKYMHGTMPQYLLKRFKVLNNATRSHTTSFCRHVAGFILMGTRPCPQGELMPRGPLLLC